MLESALLVSTLLRQQVSARVPPPPRAPGQCESRGRDDLVFPGADGSYVRSARGHEDNHSQFPGAVKRSGISRITPHDLRHSAASFAVSRRRKRQSVQRMLGHSSAAMTLDIYADLFDDDLDGVANALDHAVSHANVATRLIR